MADRNQRGSLEDAMAKMEEIRASAEQTLTAYVEANEELGHGGDTEVQSEDGMIKVALGPDGKLTRIEIDDSVLRLKNNLEPKIIAVVEEAFATRALRQAEVAERVLGNVDMSSFMGNAISPETMARARDNLGR
ncbi:YbaB/EbfC family nucleoid-associated protein [Salininema proteolyticum]|uniref:YbaB/EbfC family nucleoid-associated protein n=1 Tax=Salininema proteolyticum TaxID=1607685 RepID=A0ABV8TWN7_9ACTN